MKTISDLKKKIKEMTFDLSSLGVSGEEDAKELKRLKTAAKKIEDELNRLREVLLYLNMKPAEGFLRKEKDRLENRIKLIDDIFLSDHNTEKMTRPQINIIKKDHDKKWEAVRLRTHLKYIDYILEIEK